MADIHSRVGTDDAPHDPSTRRDNLGQNSLCLPATNKHERLATRWLLGSHRSVALPTTGRRLSATFAVGGVFDLLERVNRVRSAFMGPDAAASAWTATQRAVALAVVQNGDWISPGIFLSQTQQATMAGRLGLTARAVIYALHGRPDRGLPGLVHGSGTEWWLFESEALCDVQGHRGRAYWMRPERLEVVEARLYDLASEASGGCVRFALSGGYWSSHVNHVHQAMRTRFTFSKRDSSSCELIHDNGYSSGAAMPDENGTVTGTDSPVAAAVAIQGRAVDSLRSSPGDGQAKAGPHAAQDGPGTANARGPAHRPSLANAPEGEPRSVPELAARIATMIKGTHAARWWRYAQGRTGRCLADLEALGAAGHTPEDILTAVRVYLAAETRAGATLAYGDRAFEWGERRVGPGLSKALNDHKWFGWLLEGARGPGLRRAA